MYTCGINEGDAVQQDAAYEHGLTWAMEHACADAGADKNAPCIHAHHFGEMDTQPVRPTQKPQE
jgi:hypothetical protein